MQVTAQKLDKDEVGCGLDVLMDLQNVSKSLIVWVPVVGLCIVQPAHSIVQIS